MEINKIEIDIILDLIAIAQRVMPIKLSDDILIFKEKLKKQTTTDTGE
jgi:hypothetical protein